ncbi:MAG: hypothetical protein ACRDRI_04975 [Pseudonocardiaceae bacterium]
MTTERNSSVPDRDDHPTGRCRKAIPATCQLNRGPVQYADLMVSKRDGTIVLDPRITGSCVMSLDEHGAAKLRDLLTEWLG